MDRARTAKEFIALSVAMVVLVGLGVAHAVNIHPAYYVASKEGPCRLHPVMTPEDLDKVTPATGQASQKDG